MTCSDKIKSFVDLFAFTFKYCWQRRRKLCPMCKVKMHDVLGGNLLSTEKIEWNRNGKWETIFLMSYCLFFFSKEHYLIRIDNKHFFKIHQKRFPSKLFPVLQRYQLLVRHSQIHAYEKMHKTTNWLIDSMEERSWQVLSSNYLHFTEPGSLLPLYKRIVLLSNCLWCKTWIFVEFCIWSQFL